MVSSILLAPAFAALFDPARAYALWPLSPSARIRFRPLGYLWHVAAPHPTPGGTWRSTLQADLGYFVVRCGRRDVAVMYVENRVVLRCVLWEAAR